MTNGDDNSQYGNYSTIYYADYDPRQNQSDYDMDMDYEEHDVRC